MIEAQSAYFVSFLDIMNDKWAQNKYRESIITGCNPGGNKYYLFLLALCLSNQIACNAC